MARLRHCDLRPKEREDNIKRSSATINKSILQLVMCCTVLFSLLFLLLFYIRAYHVNVPEQSFLNKKTALVRDFNYRSILQVAMKLF